MTSILNYCDFIEFENKFNSLNNIYDDNIMEYEESKIFLNNLIEMYYYFDAINPLSFLIMGPNEEIKKKIEFLNNNFIKFRYYIKKFKLYDLLNDEIKNFYDNIFKLYLKFNNIIELKNFESNLLTKINNKYYYNNTILEENKIFMHYELKNDLYFYYISNNKIIHNNSIDKNNCAFLNLINMNIEINKSRLKNFEILKYYDKIIELKQRIKELKKI